MKYCFRCGQELEKNDIFCFSCGARQSMARNRGPPPMTPRPSPPAPRPVPPPKEVKPRPPPPAPNFPVQEPPPQIQQRLHKAPLHVYEKEAVVALLLSILIPGAGLLYVDSNRYLTKFLFSFLFFWLIIPYILGLIWSIEAVETYNQELYNRA